MSKVITQVTPEKKKTLSESGFPTELCFRVSRDLDKKWFFLYLGIFLSLGLVTLLLSTNKPSLELTEKEALRIKERYARLEAMEKRKQEEKKEEKQVVKAEEKKEIQKEEVKEEKPKVDREKESVEQKEERKKAGAEERAATRQKLAEQVTQSGLFAELAALGDAGANDRVVEDVLSKSGAGDLSNLDLKSTDFAQRPSATTGALSKERRGERLGGVAIGESKIEKAEVKKIETSGEVKLATAPTTMEGEGKNDASRTYAQIREVISKIQGNIKLQFEKFLKQEPTLNGQVDIEFTIKADGSVGDVRVAKSSLNHPGFERRMVSMIQRLVFPSASADVRITYPFIFTSNQS